MSFSQTVDKETTRLWLRIASTKTLQSYLSNRKQRTKINTTYSSWEEILFGVPQGSVLGPSFFNIFLRDLFRVTCETDFTIYSDENTPYVLGDMH